MPLFRFHRGGLLESLKTTIIVNDAFELCVALVKAYGHWPDYQNVFSVEITANYGGLDERIGWFTELVSVKTLSDENHCATGMLSEPLVWRVDYEKNYIDPRIIRKFSYDPKNPFYQPIALETGEP